MWKHILSTFLLVSLCSIALAVSLRGIPGTPTSAQLNDASWKEDGPLELSPDRGRYALAYSLVEDRSFQFSLPIARFATPDVAYTATGQYVSLFAPGLSFLIIPGYLIGKLLGAGQVGAFAIISLFAVANVLLVRAIAIRLGARDVAATLGAVAFLFASPAFTYAVTLYQHHVTTFLLLLSVYLLLRWNTLWSLAGIWFLWATSVVVDNPNLIIMLPVGLAALGRLVFVQRSATAWRVVVRPLGALTFLLALLPVLFFLWVNYSSYGDPFQLAGTLPSAQVIDSSGLPVEVSDREDPGTKTALGFFPTRNLLNGFYVHSVSPDRGVLWYTPVLLLGILGFVVVRQRRLDIRNVFVAVIGFTVLLYSLWGDPWGGWAFGSRYLIPVYALLSVGVALALSHWRSRWVFLALFFILFGYSVWVNSLGALTSSANPPEVEVLALEAATGHEQKYTFERNWDYLHARGSKSFVWQTVGRQYVSASLYHALLTLGIMVGAGVLVVGLAWGAVRYPVASLAARESYGAGVQQLFSRVISFLL